MLISLHRLFFKKYYKLDGLSNKHLLLTVLEVGKSKIVVAANLVPDEDSLLGLSMATFLQCSHVEERDCSLFSFLLL